MIVPNSTPISGTSAVTREGAVADYIYSCSAAAGGRAPEFVFSWQVAELDATFPESLRPFLISTGMDFPSSHAMGIARDLCHDVDRILGTTVSFSGLECFEGDLLIHWRSAERGITLICPSDLRREPKLYREELSGPRLLKSDIAANPHASDVAREINWVWKRD